MKSRFQSRCSFCGQKVEVGMEVVKRDGVWGHFNCKNSLEEAPVESLPDRCQVKEGMFSLHFEYNYQTVQAVKALPYRSRRWDGSCWWVELKLLETLGKGIREANSKLAQEILEGSRYEPARTASSALQKNMREEIAASRALTSDIEIPCPEGIHYFPFQKAAVEYLSKRDSSLLSDRQEVQVSTTKN